MNFLFLYLMSSKRRMSLLFDVIYVPCQNSIKSSYFLPAFTRFLGVRSMADRPSVTAVFWYIYALCSVIP